MDNLAAGHPVHVDMNFFYKTLTQVWHSFTLFQEVHVYNFLQTMCLKMPLDGDAHYEGSDINVNAA